MIQASEQSDTGAHRVPAEFANRTRWLLVCVILIAMATTRLCAERPRQHALLIGCTEYRNLDPWLQLKGGLNDVQLIRQLLVDRFDFDPNADDIVTLAAGRGDRYAPTRTNIEREFRRLGKTVAASERVVILVAGHGSQQPDDDPGNPRDIETDGLDEIFLPSDVEGFDGKTGSVSGAIVDDEFRHWLSAIVARDAFVWLIMDTCHSGSGVRGSGAEISRHVPPRVLIPDSALAAAKSATIKKHGHLAPDSLFDGPGGVVAIYAAQPHELTPEKKLPVGASPDARKYHGLLTYTIGEILTGSRRGLTYNELVQAVQTRYITMGRRAPTPLVEGTHRDHLVLGRKSFPDRSRILLRRSRIPTGNLSVNVGAIHTLTAGSILAVHPPSGSNADDPDALLGHVKVTRVEMTEAVVEPCKYGGVARPEISALPNRARCDIVFRHAGIERMRVAIDVDDQAENDIPAAFNNLASDLRTRTSNRIVVIDDAGDAEWLVRCGERDIQIIPAEGVSRRDLAGHRSSLAPIATNGDSARRVIQVLERIAHARALLRLAAFASDSSRKPDFGFALNVTDPQHRPLEWKSSGYTVRDGQHVQVEMHNTAGHSIDVTLLYVDSGFGITCLYPAIGEINRIAAAEKQIIELDITATTTGIESLLAIAVKADLQPVDFSILAQPSLPLTRDGGSALLESPLGRLCRTAMYGRGKVRGIESAPNQNYDIRLITWRVDP